MSQTGPTAARRPRPATVLGVLVVLGLLAAGGVRLVRADWGDSGPLTMNHAGRDSPGQDSLSISGVRPGTGYTYGFLVMNRAIEPAALQEVELVGDTDGVRTGPVLTAGPERAGGSIATADAFPPEQLGVQLRPLAESVVPPLSDRPANGQPPLGVNILVRMELQDDRVHRFTGARVRYSVNGKTYTYTDPVSLMLCPAACPAG